MSSLAGLPVYSVLDTPFRLLGLPYVLTCVLQLFFLFVSHFLLLFFKSTKWMCVCLKGCT